MNNFIPPVKMEAITANILTRNGYSLEWDGQIHPVDIDSIIEFDKASGLDFVSQHLEHLASVALSGR